MSQKAPPGATYIVNNNLKILYINSIDYGGGAIGARRIYDSLPDHYEGMEISKESLTLSNEFDLTKFMSNPSILDKLLSRLRARRYYKKRRFYILNRPSGLESFQRVDHYRKNKLERPFDIIHLHWFGGEIELKYFIDNLPKLTSIVITLHDLSFCTGGCPYPLGCQHFESHCYTCPQLSNSNELDLANTLFTVKKKMLSRSGIYLVANSKWTESIAKKSAITRQLPVQTIHFPIDLTVYSPVNKSLVRAKIGIPENKKVILFAADNLLVKRKRIDIVVQLIELLNEDYFFVSFGNGQLDIRTDQYRNFGYQEDEFQKADLYNAADVLVFTSEEEAFGIICQEALACGTPVIALQNGGINDLISDNINGYILETSDIQQIAKKLLALLDDDEKLTEFSGNARRLALEKFSWEMTTKKYLSLYQSILCSNN